MVNNKMAAKDVFYICRFFEHDGAVVLAEEFDCSPQNIRQMVARAKEDGLFEEYKKAWDRLYESY